MSTPSGADKPRKPKGAWIPKRPDPRGAAPARLGDVLLGVENFTAKRSGAAMPRGEWTTIVGPRIAARTRVGKLYGGVLTIKVASSAWGNELSFLKPDLLQKLRRAGHDITDLRFRVDRIEGASDNPRKGLRKYAPLPEAVSLPAELTKRLEQIEDPNLRAAIAEAARHSFKPRDT